MLTYRREAEFYYRIAPKADMFLLQTWFCGSDTVNGQGTIIMANFTIQNVSFGAVDAVWPATYVYSGVSSLWRCAERHGLRRRRNTLGLLLLVVVLWYVIFLCSHCYQFVLLKIWHNHTSCETMSTAPISRNIQEYKKGSLRTKRGGTTFGKSSDHVSEPPKTTTLPGKLVTIL